MSSTDLSDLIDADKGFLKCRRLLVAIELIVISLFATEAKIKEAGGFIFTIEFGNPSAIRDILLLTMLFLILRYYAFAMKYHDLLFTLIADEVVNNKRMRNYDEVRDEFDGLLTKVVDDDVFLGRGYQSPVFKYYKSGFLKRNICFDIIEDNENYLQEVNFDFKIYSENWGRVDYIRVLYVESLCRLKLLIFSRAYFDVILPYVLGGIAIACYLYSTDFISLASIWVVSFIHAVLMRF